MKINWLLIGTGDIANKRIGPALLNDKKSSLYGVFDKDSKSAFDFAARHSAPIIFNSIDEALADEKINAVYISTPIFLHKEMTLTALKAGKHVLVEKPMALNAEDAFEMVKKADEAEKKLGVSYFRRYYDKYKYIRKMLINNEFGKIVLVRLTYFSWYNPAKDDPKYWRVIPEKSGGGPISDMGTHMFDLLIGLFDLPRSVFARVETNVHEYKVEDSASIIMKLRNNAQAVATFHWCSKTWSHEFEIIGTEAKIKWHPFDSSKFVKTEGRDIQEIDMHLPENVHSPLISDFTGWIIDGGEFVCSGKEAAKTNILVDAVYKSASKNREIIL